MRRSPRSILWKRVGFLFDTDDGSLPEVRIVGLSPDGVARIFEALRARAEPLSRNVTLWHEELEEQVPVVDVPDAAELVASGRISAFHVRFTGIEGNGVVLPLIGAFVDPEDVALDYQMGPEWNAEVLAAFVDLLAELCALDSAARLDFEPYAAPEVRDLFVESVDQYVSAIGANRRRPQ